MPGSTPSDAASAAFERYRSARAKRGQPLLPADELLRAVAALLREDPETYVVPRGQALVGVEAVARDGAEWTAKLEDGAIDPDDRAAFDNALARVAEAFVATGAQRLPTAEQLLAVIGFSWSKLAELPPRWTPILDGARREASPTLRRFRHPDGRVWAIGVRGAVQHLRVIDPDDPEPVERSRAFTSEQDCVAASDALVVEQLQDGFVEDVVTLAVASRRRGDQRAECQDRHLVDLDLGLFVVADAFGHASAAEETIACIRAGVLAARSDPAAVLRVAIEEADRLIHDASLDADPALRGIGCTVVAMLTRADAAYLAYVPHCRAWAVRRDDLELLTPDDWSHPPRFDAVDVPLERHQPIGSGSVAVRALSFPIGRGEAWLLSSDGLHQSHEAAELRDCTVDPDEGLPTTVDDAQQLVCRLTWFSSSDDDRTVVYVTAGSPATARERAFPGSLLNDIEWSLTGRLARTAASSAMRSIVLPAERAEFVFSAWDPGVSDRVDTVVTLTAAQPGGFTGLELVRGLRRAIRESLARSGRRLGDHYHPEGLSLVGVRGGIPTYHLTLGS